MTTAELRKSPAAWFVAAVWLVGSVLLFRFVHAFGVDFPQWDEFSHLAVLTHDEPLTWSWLWQPHNEHRIPMAKLTWVVTSALTHGNYRVPMFLSAGLLVLAAAALPAAVAWYRGCVRFSDAALALLLLNLAQFENLTWGHQIVFVFGAVLPVLFAAATLRWPRAIHLQGALAAACWGWGMGPALFLAAAGSLFAVRAVCYSDEPRTLRRQHAFWATALLVLFASYIFSYKVVAHHEGVRKSGALFGYFLRLVGDALAASQSAWPVPTVLVVICLVLTAITCTGRQQFRTHDGVITLLAFEMILCVVITWGRTPLGIEQAFSSRYVTLVAPLLLAAYALGDGRPSATRVSELATTMILVASAGAYAYGAGFGVEAARASRKAIRSAVVVVFGTDERTAGFQTANVLFPDPVELAAHLGRLKRAHLSVFSHPATIESWRKHEPPPQPLGVTPLPNGAAGKVVEPDASLGAPGLLVHAPGRLTFDVVPGTYDLRGSFGFRPGAYLGGSTDGADFSVWLETSSRRQVWMRHLDPVSALADRGAQRIELTFEVSDAGRLLLETERGPSGSDAFDWTVWADLQLARRPP